MMGAMLMPKEVYLELNRSTLDGLNQMKEKEVLILKLEGAFCCFFLGFRDINIPATVCSARKSGGLTGCWSTL